MNHLFTDIAITGYSAITPAGIGITPILDLLQSGGTALTAIPAGVPGADRYLWGKAGHFKVSEFMSPLKARKMDRCSQFAVVTAGHALKDAGIDMKQLAPDRIGIAMGSGFCGVANSAEFLSGYFKDGVDGLVPMIFPNTVPNAPASNVSIEHGLKGPNVTLVQRFCSAESAILAACRFIQEGRADIMLTGGADELTPLMMQGFAAMGLLQSVSPSYGEGCGMLVLESLPHARRRGAGIRGHLCAIRTVGQLIADHEQEGLAILAGTASAHKRVSLSGCAGDVESFRTLAGGTDCFDLGRVVGRSLAMGGTALAVLLASLADGEAGLHLAASAQGPCFSVDICGGSPV
jgi:3-oxoacyl-(acyl-carrier-protein) synthase